jgi:SAM-dependent methyltransferase
LRAWAEKDGRGYPDWAVRYLPVLRRLRAQKAVRGCILEIGANENGFARFAGVRTIAVDLAVEHLRAARAAQEVLPVVADIAALPFRDGTFDLAVCMDVFEHLPDAVRDGAAAEIVRALRAEGTAVVGFPSGDAASDAEKRVREAYGAFTGDTLHWLEEHAAQGLPDATRVFDRFHDLAGETHRVWRTGNASVRIWEWMWKVLMCGWPGRGNAVFQVVLRTLVPMLSRKHSAPCYRVLIWIEPRGDQGGRDLERNIPRRSAAPLSNSKGER